MVVRLPLEGRPSFHLIADSLADENRFYLWLTAAPALLDLAGDALALLNTLLDAYDAGGASAGRKET
jgi:hypothetical protein